MAIEINIGAWQVQNIGAWQNLSGAELPVAAHYPINRLRKNVISGYHCFMDAYLRAKQTELDPLKLPDGTVF